MRLLRPGNILTAGILLLLIGCANHQPAPAAPAAPKPAALTADQIKVWEEAKQEFQLAGFRDKGSEVALPERPPTIAFFAGRAGGFAGVNRYNGGYQLGPGGTFSFGPAASTMMAGPEPAMRLEESFLKSLERVRRVRLEGDSLVFEGEDQTVLTFRKKQ